MKIILYYDDVEITNEHTKRKHKLAMFYFQLANLYPELKSINLVAIVEYRYLKKHGMDKILAPFIEDLKRLGRDTGVDFKVHGGVVRPKRCIAGRYSRHASQPVTKKDTRSRLAGQKGSVVIA